MLFILASAQTQQYLGNISTYDSYDLPSLRVWGTNTFLLLPDKPGNASVVLLSGNEQRPLDSWADFMLFDAVRVQQIFGVFHLHSGTHTRYSDPHCPHTLSV